ncbi:hypothetical protein CVT26_015106 [Gymnopilus dilepis]|uniref:Cytosine-specific methyltransferase n=1 Tax=Gymnopilus dilepis TaxID=231916 RepID=A0A409YEQ1_9AGAR|nr:hypothetical protein CVT26_015106 [Gymnopilus dilepis]
MGVSGLVPYVDIVIDPALRATLRNLKRPFSDASDVDPLEPSPKKKRLRSGYHSSNESSQGDLDQPLSPTVSDYEFEAEQQLLSDEGAYDSDNLSTSVSFLDGRHGEGRKHYYTPGDEVAEDAQLRIAGETAPVEEDSDCTIPIRLLSDYTIYNLETRRLVAVDELLQLDYCKEQYAASGLVRPWFGDGDSLDDGQSDDDDRRSSASVSEDDRITLTRLLEFSIHSSSEEDLLDSKIYIRTKFAWYILGCPSQLYTSYFSPFWIRHRLLHLLIMAAVNNKHTTYEQFSQNLPDLDETEGSIVTAQTILGRQLRGEDLTSDDTMAYLLSALPDICASNGIRIASVPVIQRILGKRIPSSRHSANRSNAKVRQTRTETLDLRRSSNPERAVLKHHGRTFLTDVVNRIAKNLFEVSLDVAEALVDQDDEEVAQDLPRFKAHYSNPGHMEWGKKFKGPGKTYWSLYIDGVLYTAGDIVMVEPGTESASAEVLKASQTINKYGNRWWFCQIRYFFEIPSKSGTVKMFHGHWFMHGSKTLLQETSHSKALYLLNQCDDNPVTSIFRKCNFRILQSFQQEVVDDGSSDSNDFFCSHLYDEEMVAFVDIPEGALTVTRDGPSKSCFSCLHKAKEDSLADIMIGTEETTIYGIKYHVHDFVYIHPGLTSGSILLEIGQITKFQKQQVAVRLLGRYDEYVKYQKKLQSSDCDLIADERRLYLRDEVRLISADEIDGLCHVLHSTDEAKIKAWIQEDDHFYLSEAGSKEHLYPIKQKDLAVCISCRQADSEAIQHARRFQQTNSKLVGMELFSGAGGLGTGMQMSGFVETKYAVEFSPAAAKTYMKNHPDTKVYCQDSSNLLKYAILGKNSNGKSKPPSSNIDGTECPPLPKKTDGIDFIFGGPPCQSFSRANHSKRRDDIRSTLACNMLSYVEHYEPTYFLLENVAGFLDHKFYNTRETKSGEIESEIQFGMVKFVMRTLIALGYQAHFKLLQSGQYGIPQSRNRVIFWAAKRGVPLPKFPIPVYAFPKAVHRVKLPTGDSLDPPTRCKIPTKFHHFAPFKPRTVNDAIGDLPCFDWENPHKIIPETNQSYKSAKKRQDELGIPSFEAVAEGRRGDFGDLPGYPMGATYPCQPQNSYQRWLRQGMETQKLLTGHYTTRLGSKIIEANLDRTDYLKDLPSSVLPNYAKPHAQKKNKTFYGRMDGNGFFKCAVTTLSPNLKNQWPLHPSQKRIITVREAARSQGFPDDYIFESCNTSPSQIVQDQLRQIGNAVAVPFALALGKELGKAMILKWQAKEREGSVPL